MTVPFCDDARHRIRAYDQFDVGESTFRQWRSAEGRQATIENCVVELHHRIHVFNREGNSLYVHLIECNYCTKPGERAKLSRSIRDSPHGSEAVAGAEALSARLLVLSKDASPGHGIMVPRCDTGAHGPPGTCYQTFLSGCSGWSTDRPKKVKVQLYFP
jgi:hypothetical protein